MQAKRLVPVLLLAAALLPLPTWAESKEVQADRELAQELSAALVVVSAEMRKFADIRDQLAKTRLRTLQGLENNLVWIQEGNDFDVRVWKVIGETYRGDLFQGVLDATDDLAARRKAAAERQTQQAQRLAATRSAVSRKTSELGSAAASLAALAEPPVSGQAVSALIQDTLSQLATRVGEESPKLQKGLELASQIAGQVEARLEAPR